MKRLKNLLCDYGLLINSSDNPDRLNNYINYNVFIAILLGFAIGYYFLDIATYFL